MLISTSMKVSGSAGELYSWWSDYTEGVIDNSRMTKVTRKIVSREGNRIVMDDTFTRPVRFVDRTVVDLKPPDTIQFHSESSVWILDGRYSFTQSGKQVEAKVQVNLMPQGIWRLVFALPFVKGRIIREFEEDLRGHLSDFEKETGGTPA